jgi:hypothetical protein
VHTSDHGRGIRTDLFTIIPYRTSLRPASPPVNWVQRPESQNLQESDFFHLLLRPRMRRVFLSAPFILSWVQERCTVNFNLSSVLEFSDEVFPAPALWPGRDENWFACEQRCIPHTVPDSALTCASCIPIWPVYSQPNQTLHGQSIYWYEDGRLLGCQPCSLVDVYGRFTSVCNLHHLGGDHRPDDWGNIHLWNTS